uniref:Uncharacterized protein n=1 Tax=Glossina pallidipes TaxID=7398 RepID=A0A1A9ZWT2_GLOPL
MENLSDNLFKLNSLPTLITTDSFLVDTSIEVHNHPFVAVDYDDAFADALRDEVVAVSFAVVYGRSNAAFDPKALALADLDPFSRQYLPGDNSDTGVLDGVGLCPGGR